MRRPRLRTVAVLAVLASGPSALLQAQPQEPGRRGSQEEHVVEHETLQALPLARDLGSVLEHIVPAVISDRYDVGGATSERQALLSARAASWRQAVYRLDGVNVTDPATAGAAAFFFDFDAVDEVRVTTSAASAAVQSPGILTRVVLRSGSDDLHGSAQYFFEGGALQASNGTDDSDDGAQLEGGRLDYLSDGSFQIGGPVARDRLWLFGAYRDWRLSRTEPGFDPKVETALPVYTLKGSVRVGEAGRFHAFWSRQAFSKSHRNAHRFLAPEATWKEEDTFDVAQGRWVDEIGGNVTLDLSAALFYVSSRLGLQPEASGQASYDLISNTRGGAAQFDIENDRHRLSAAALSTIAPTGGGGAHRFDLGVRYDHTPQTVRLSAVDDVHVVTSGGTPFQAILLNTPLVSQQGASVLGAYVQDRWTINDRLTLDLGVRWDWTRAWLPAQSSPAGTYVEERQFAQVGDLFGWSVLAPRLGLSGDVFGDGKTVFNVGFALYGDRVGTATIALANPNSLASGNVAWVDRNGDAQFQPGEGLPPLTIHDTSPVGIDPAFSSPRTLELTAGLSQALGDDWVAGVQLFYREVNDLYDDVEVGVDFDDDFDEVVVRDPGPDNTPFTGDDQGILVYNQMSGFGDSELLLANVDDKVVELKGLDLSLARRFSNHWQLSAVATFNDINGMAGKSGLIPGDAGGTSDLYDDPNAQTNAFGRLFWHRPFLLKVSGTWELPHGFLLGGVFRSVAGEPIARIIQVPLNQGIVDVYAEFRGSERLDAVNTFDLGLAKDFSLPRSTRLTLHLDLFNVANAGTVTGVSETVPTYLVPTHILPARVIRLGARFRF